MTDSELIVVTASYGTYRDWMGVPVGTSIGRHPGYKTAPECDPLKPWTTFRKMADQPPEQQRARYHRQLTESKARVKAALWDLHLSYPHHPLVLLCWCNLFREDVGPMGCHRRWAADWLVENSTLEDVPELLPNNTLF